ncbi:MAG: hypothetical protein C5B53_09000 [Candidatus Melainabacteria bacterium]|nr:MAG: hypothetical protein C5B53_09000 [Candidatus Melainabacteria bacterium]
MTTGEVSYRLSGVVRHHGLPVAGVSVSIFDAFDETNELPHLSVAGRNANPVGQLKTNAKGEFAFAVRPGTYRLEAIPDESTRFLKHAVKEIPVLVANNSSIVNLNTGLLLSGKAFRSDGRPLRGGAVIAVCIEPALYLTAGPVSINGEYSLVVPPGKFQIAYLSQAKDYLEEACLAIQNSGVEIDADELIPSLAIKQGVVDVESDAQFDLVLPPLVGFNGEVVGGPQPLEGALITVVPAATAEHPFVNEFPLLAESKSDGRGNFKLYLEPGPYDISIEPPKESLLFGLIQKNVQVKENCFQRFVLPSGYRLKGQVVCNDKVLADALVRVLAFEQEREFIAKSDPGGRIELSLPGGDYHVIVLAHPKDSATKTINGIEYTGLAPFTSVVAVRGDTDATFKLEEGVALFGRVKDESGNPRAGIKVSIFMESDFKPGQVNSRRAISSGTTDHDGNYCFFLCPGTYWLVIHRDYANAKRVTIGKDDTNFEITWQGWCQLHFEVTGEDGVKIARCKLHSSRYAALGMKSNGEGGNGLSDPTDCLMHTGEDGVCQVTLPAGIYTFEFEPPSGSSYGGKVLRQLSVSADLSRKIALPLKGASRSGSSHEA